MRGDTSTRPRPRCRLDKVSSRALLPEGPLVHFGNASRLDHGRFFLAFRKQLRSLTVDVDSGELLAIMVKHSDEPVPVLAAAVTVEAAIFLGLFHFRVGGASDLTTLLKLILQDSKRPRK